MNQNSRRRISVTLINVFEVSTEHVNVFVAQWRERAVLMSTSLDSWIRGSTALSRRQVRFQLVNVAHWETARRGRLPRQILSSNRASAPKR